jgi:cell division septation protein DedD
MDATITEQSWKGHSFTLLVFTGIVVLSSIFFILGMLVGRSQGQKIASTSAPAAASKADAKAAKEEDKTDFTFYDSVKKDPSAALAPVTAKPEPPAPGPSAQTKAAAPLEQLPPPPVTSKPANAVNYQVGAVKKSADAERLLSDVKKKGFKAFIMSPTADEANPYFRILVGPFTDPIEAEQVKKNLEAAGFKKPMLKK